MVGKKRYTEEEAAMRRKESFKRYRDTHKDLLASRRKKYMSYRPEKRLIWAASKRAKEQNLPFNLDESDIIIPEVCPYLGIPLVSNSSRGSTRTAVASLDKIIPELGYVKGNVEVISHLANSMKSNATRDQLLKFATEILRRYNEETSGEGSNSGCGDNSKEQRQCTNCW